MRALVALVIAFVAGVILANATHTNEVDFVEIPGKTRTVTEPAPDPVEVEVYPQDCLDAMTFATVIVNASEKMFNISDRQIALLSDARVALAEGGDLSAVENKQRWLQGDLVGSLYDMEEALSKFEDAYDECKEQVK